MDYCQPLNLQRGAAKGAGILLFLAECMKRERANGAEVTAFAQHTKPPVKIPMKAVEQSVAFAPPLLLGTALRHLACMQDGLMAAAAIGPLR